MLEKFCRMLKKFGEISLIREYVFKTFEKCLKINFFNCYACLNKNLLSLTYFYYWNNTKFKKHQQAPQWLCPQRPHLGLWGTCSPVPLCTVRPCGMPTLDFYLCSTVLTVLQKQIDKTLELFQKLNQFSGVLFILLLSKAYVGFKSMRLPYMSLSYNLKDEL